MSRKVSLPSADPQINGSAAHVPAEPTPAPTASVGPDPKLVDALRLPPALLRANQVRRHWNTIPVRKPEASQFVRTHPDPNYRAEFGTVEISVKESRQETYVLRGDVAVAWQNDASFRIKTFVTTVTKNGSPFLWFVNNPREAGKNSSWYDSAMDAIETAQHLWVRIKPDEGISGYEVIEAVGNYGDPVWPDLTFEEIVRIAFRGKIIDSLDHLVLRQLEGKE